MSGDRFSRLDSADDFLDAVRRSVARHAEAAGAASWNYSPAYSQVRQRSVRLLVRAVSRREAEADRLASSAPVPAAGAVIRARLRQRAQARDARARTGR